MYSINETPVFQKVFDLLKEYHTLRSKFPKTEKYTLGERIEETILTALIGIIEAGHVKKEWKLQPIEQSLRKTELAKILFRLAFETRCITERQYLTTGEQLQRIGQMLGGWRRSL
ncbi:four helix bundle protein [Candidatus Uhrbacteria bacterium]|nr:four helix bundle protein [Candidatus Uhrbacteria bacterium]